jgi:hypothetical protein
MRICGLGCPCACAATAKNNQISILFTHSLHAYYTMKPFCDYCKWQQNSDNIYLYMVQLLR